MRPCLGNEVCPEQSGASSFQTLLPGPYARQEANGEYEAHFNIVKGGQSFRLGLEPQTGVFKLEAGQASIPLLPILRELGVPDATITKTWGNELFAANQNAMRNPTDAVRKARERLGQLRAHREVGAPEPTLSEVFGKMEVDPEVTARSVGSGYTHVTPDLILAATRKLVGIHKGTETTDDRDSLANQEIYSVEDLLHERIKKDADHLMRRVLWKATANKGLKSIPAALLDKYVDNLFHKSGLAQALEETNPIEVLDQNLKVTRMGVGGMPGYESVPAESRNVQPSQFLFIDPVRTPESMSVGIDMSEFARAELRRHGLTPAPSDASAFRCQHMRTSRGCVAVAVVHSDHSRCWAGGESVGLRRGVGRNAIPAHEEAGQTDVEGE